MPQTMQKHFCNAAGNLWYSEKLSNGMNMPAELRSPKGAFCRRNYYTVLENEAPSDLVERQYYGKLDDYLGNAIPSLLGALRAERIPKLSSNMQIDLKKAVYRMLLRTPDFEKPADLDLGIQYLKTLISTAKDDPRYKDNVMKAKQELRDEVKLNAYGRDIRVWGTLGNHPKSVDELMKRSIRWVIAPPKTSYVLCSSIALRIGKGGSNGLINPKTEIWMPISPKYCLVLVKDDPGRIPPLNLDTRDHVREVNEYATKVSWAIASHSEKLIRSLTKT